MTLSSTQRIVCCLLALSILCFFTGSARAGNSPNIPEDVKAFLADYAQSVIDGNADKIMDHYSSDFLLNGRGKEETKEFWERLLKRTSFNTFSVELSEFKSQGDKALVAGFVTANGRQTTLAIPAIIKEAGQWKWYGQLNRAVSDSESVKLDLSFVDPAWNGKKVPEGQQCRRFGGKPFTPSIRVKNIPNDAGALILEFSDQDWPPMDNGGHGRIGYVIPKGAKEVTVPSVPGHSMNLPEGFFLIEAHRGAGWDKAGAYMPPCSGGRGNLYYVTIKAVSGQTSTGKVLAAGRLDLGVY